MEHAMDEDTLLETEADQTGLAIVAENVIRRTQKYDGVDYDLEFDEEENYNE